jgi:hypothetical protein
MWCSSFDSSFLVEAAATTALEWDEFETAPANPSPADAVGAAL